MYFVPTIFKRSRLVFYAGKKSIYGAKKTGTEFAPIAFYFPFYSLSRAAITTKLALDLLNLKHRDSERLLIHRRKNTTTVTRR